MFQYYSLGFEIKLITNAIEEGESKKRRRRRSGIKSKWMRKRPNFSSVISEQERKGQGDREREHLMKVNRSTASIVDARIHIFLLFFGGLFRCVYETENLLQSISVGFLEVGGTDVEARIYIYEEDKNVSITEQILITTFG